MQRTKIFERAEKRQNYYAFKHLENQNNEHTRIEGKTGTVEEELGNNIAEERRGVEESRAEINRNESSAVAVVSIANRNTGVAERSFNSSDTEFQPNIKLRNEINDRGGSQPTSIRAKRELSAIDERTGTANQQFGNENYGNEFGSSKSIERNGLEISEIIERDRLEISESFRHDEHLGTENRFEFQIDRQNPSEFAESNSSESTARRRTDEVETIEQPAAGQKIPPAVKYAGESKPAAEIIAGKQSAKNDFDDLLRTAENEPQFAVGDEQQQGIINTQQSDSTSRNKLPLPVGGKLSEVTTDDEIMVEHSQQFQDNFNFDVQLDNNPISDFSDNHILANDRRDVGGDFGRNSDILNLHNSDVHSRSGSGVLSTDFRSDIDLWDDILPLESEFERGLIHPGGFEFFDAGTADSEFSAAIPFSKFSISEPAKPELPQPFAEIEQIFAAQKQQETLADQIVRTANEQSLQNRQVEINRAVQERMFAYLMQLSQSNAQNSPSFDSSGNSTMLEIVHQNFMTDTRNLEQFTQSVEDRYSDEQKEKSAAAENAYRANQSSEEAVCDEEIESREDHPDYEPEFSISMSM